jgi:O-antigen ligase
MLVSWRIGTRQLIAVVAALAVAVGALFLVPAVRGRLAEFSDPTEASTAIHFQLWETAIGFANEKPVFGGGPYSFVERTRRSDESDQPAHNFVLEAAADTGWVGAAYTLAFVLALLRFGWTRLRGAPPIAFALWTGLLGAVLMNLTMNGFREDMWWVWAALVVAVGIQVDAAKRAAGPEEAPCASS